MRLVYSAKSTKTLSRAIPKGGAWNYGFIVIQTRYIFRLFQCQIRRTS